MLSPIRITLNNQLQPLLQPLPSSAYPSSISRMSYISLPLAYLQLPVLGPLANQTHFLTFPSQLGHSSSPECCPFTAHALFPRFYATVPGIFRSICSPRDRAPKGLHITYYCIDSGATELVSACLRPSFPPPEPSSQLSTQSHGISRAV